MSDDTNETPANNEPHSVTPVVDARSGESVSEPAPASADAQEMIEQGGAPETAAPIPPSAGEESRSASVTTDDWSIQPESAEGGSKKHAKKPKVRAADDAEAYRPEDTEPAVPVSAVDGSAGDVSAVPTDLVTPAEEAEEPALPENKKRWYAIKVQSGREDTIKAAILRKVAIEGLEEVFGQIMVPVDKVIEKRAVKVKDKKTGEYTTVERKVERKVKKFQGYIFAELEFNDRLLYLIRETSGVGDFLKLRPRVNDTPLPEPMSDSEVKQMLGEKVGPDAGGKQKIKIEFEKGDRVRIKEGSFKDSEGEVKEVLLPKDPTDAPRVIVTVTFWGRPLDVELEYWQVAKV